MFAKWLQKSAVKENAVEMIETLKKAVVKPGGRVIIPQNTYEYLSYKRELTIR